MSGATAGLLDRISIGCQGRGVRHTRSMDQGRSGAFVEPADC
ncbi:hypothetical protein [Variovorax ginsengisoli]|uniref:Uncharacterized protein n=1 Tax=Variovorax ginsengisoli TaxID=363844 RepID=A0ABT8SGH0_9BURK|nr:hypothetical protein [Variovorax ginsengisoli]MDN8617912.1 hypothetical protein [Variovorax ginsengisoli]MDO1537082.1 hypothetical protein [Variovorax ginsengisoli]